MVIHPSPLRPWIAGFFLAFATSLVATEIKQQFAQRFQQALATYNAGQFLAAATQLEKMAALNPSSFDVQELLGMTYAAQNRQEQAAIHLAIAVRLNPNSVPAHTNLATNLVQRKQLTSAEAEFKKAQALEPRTFDTNHNLGEFYVMAGRIRDGIPFLEEAQNLNPPAYDNGYDLALAYIDTQRPDPARKVVQQLLKQKDTPELHNLLAQVEERAGNFVVAAREYESAAQLDPTESNLFDWGSELLLHYTLDAAVEVFQHAAARYANSPRIAMGLGMSLYSHGNYDEAVKALVRAADLDPADDRCYYFLSKAYDSSPAQADEVIARFRRFAQLQPRKGRALYYYAMSLWKGRRAEDAGVDVQQIESLLKQAVEYDPKLAEAYLQLGNLYSGQRKYANAIPLYERALDLNSDLADAHYRLGQAYVHTGQREKAQEQLTVYQQVRAQLMADLDKQRAEIRQFVISSKEAPGSKQ